MSHAFFHYFLSNLIFRGDLVGELYIPGQKAAYAIRRLNSAGASRNRLLVFIDTLIALVILYRSPVNYHTLQKEDFVGLCRLRNLLSKLFLHIVAK